MSLREKNYYKSNEDPVISWCLNNKHSPGNEERNSLSTSPVLPDLSRIHVLPLSSEITKQFYPDLKVNETTNTDSTPVYQYFYKILNNEQKNTVRLFQTFLVNGQGYIVVDMDTSDVEKKNVYSGFLTNQTSIFTLGPVVQPLLELHITLIRDFSLKSSNESFLNQQNVDVVQNKPISSNYGGNKETPLRNETHCPEETKFDETGTSSSLTCVNEKSSSFNSGVRKSSLTNHKKKQSVLKKISLPLKSRFSFFKPTNYFSSQMSSCSMSPAIKEGHSSSSSSSSSHSSSSTTTTVPNPSSLHSGPFLNHNVCESPSCSPCVTVDLSSCLSSALRMIPSIVFVRTRILYLNFSEKNDLIGYLYTKHLNFQKPTSHEINSSCETTPPLDTNALSYYNSLQKDNCLSLIKFYVASTGDIPLGIVIPGITQVKIELDTIGEFSDISISPIIDTIPAAYEFDFFNDYIKPFLDTFPSRVFFENDMFTYHGVQFKVQQCYPSKASQVDLPDRDRIYWKSFNGTLCSQNDFQQTMSIQPIFSHDTDILKKWEEQRKQFNTRLANRREGHLGCRIGKSTRIHQKQPIPLHWIDVLPPSVVQNIRLMPTRLQPFSLMHAIGSLAPSDLLRLIGWPGDPSSETNNQALAAQDMRNKVSLKIIEDFSTVCSTQQNMDFNNTTKQQCVVCLEDIVYEEKILELPCSHQFHVKCVVEWLKRSILCPICKRDLREFLS